MSARLEDYALIGDCQTAALVRRDGSIDWLCLPHFDSGACFASLLGTKDNGYWRIGPKGGGPCKERRYLRDTLVLESDYTTPDGEASVIDFMPPRAGEPDLVRIVCGIRGSVRMSTQLSVRFDYGAIVPWVRRIDGGIRAIAGPDSVLLHTDVELHGKDLTTIGEFTVSEGQRIAFSLTWHPSHEPPPEVQDPERALEITLRFWRQWCSRGEIHGPYRDAIVRSLITLKALTFSPTGGIVAAPTTSLPEHIGGVRNWDYRHCWIRDATFLLYALLNSGHKEEASDFREWLLRAVAGDPARLQIMYGLSGQRRLPELSLSWLPGYEGSAPVRVGNAAAGQRQWDVYGELLDAMHQCRRLGFPIDEAGLRVERSLLRFLESSWREPDEGIWEVRGPRRQFTHSKMMVWVAFDRAVKSVERFGLDGPVERFRAVRREVHKEICEKGYNKSLNAFVQVYGSDHLDASLLMMPLVGFLPAEDPRVRGTVSAIERGLMEGGLVRRYSTHTADDGLPPGEGAFLPCSFWMVDNLALLGRRTEALQLFERLLSLRNDVGLLSEEYDLSAERLVGNFPQAFSHVGLVNSANNLLETEGPAQHRRHS